MIGERQHVECLACKYAREKKHLPPRRLVRYSVAGCDGPLYLCPHCDEGPILQIEARR